jgi:phage FluMu gp28-like protein
VLAQLGSNWAKPTGKTAGRFKMANGGKVEAVPSTSGGRGYSGNVILDEVAYYETRKPELVWESAAGAAIHGYKIRALSTPNGVGNFWHDMWTNENRNKGYSKYKVTLEDAITDGIHTLSGQTEDEFRGAILVLARSDPRIYAQMTECSFLDNEDQLIPTQYVEACRVNPCGWWEGEYFAGLDIGRTADRTELVILRKGDDGVRWISHSENRRRTDSQDIDDLVRTAFSPPFNCKRICIDATGMGAFPAEDMQRRYGRWRVEPVVFSLKSKEELATGMYTAFAQKTVRIPAYDNNLFNEVCSIRREVTAAGNVRYDAPHTAEGHGDRAWALALALYACSRPVNRRIEVGPG